MDYKKQYLKYKLKYLILKKNQTGGTNNDLEQSNQDESIFTKIFNQLIKPLLNRTQGSTVSSKQSKDKIGSGSTPSSDNESDNESNNESDNESGVSQTDSKAASCVSGESDTHPVDPLPQEGGSGSGSVYVEPEPEQEEPEPLIFEYNSELPFFNSVPEAYIKIINYGEQDYYARVGDECEVRKKLENEDYSFVESKEDKQTVFNLTKKGHESSDDQSYTSPSPPLSCEKPALPNSSH